MKPIYFTVAENRTTKTQISLWEFLYHWKIHCTWPNICYNKYSIIKNIIGLLINYK